jgi:hypothetical protein
MIAAVGTVIRTAYYQPDKSVPTLETPFPYPNHLDVRWHESPRDKGFSDIVFGMGTVYGISAKKFHALVGTSAGPEPDDAGVAADSGEEADLPAGVRRTKEEWTRMRMSVLKYLAENGATGAGASISRREMVKKGLMPRNYDWLSNHGLIEWVDQKAEGKAWCAYLTAAGLKAAQIGQLPE